MEIINRFEMLLNAIKLKDEEIIAIAVNRLEGVSLNDDAKAIMLSLKEKNYVSSYADIQNYLQKYKSLKVYESPEVLGLKIQLQVYENSLNELSLKKQEILLKINNFNQLYYKNLGQIIEEILRLKKDLAQKEFEKNTEKKDEYEKRKNEYENFYKQAIEEAKVKVLSQEEEQALKKFYRKASFLTHPDVVSEEFKELASEQFVKLNEAYKNKDLEAVKNIFEALEKGKTFEYTSAKVNDEQILKNKCEMLKTKINELENEISSLYESEAYKILKNENLDEFFENLKANLEQERDKLKEQFQHFNKK